MIESSGRRRLKPLRAQVESVPKNLFRQGGLRMVLAATLLGLLTPLPALPTAPGSAVASTSTAASTDAQSPSADPQSQASGADAADPAPVERKNPREDLKINPLTGQVTAGVGNYTPLTGDERLKLYFKQTYYSYGAYFGPFFAALVLDQTTNDPPEWGGGWRGYGRRVASRVGSNTVQNSFQAPVAALLNEDVRYIGSNEHGFKRRFKHAVLYSFLTYNHEGHPTPNVANLGGYYVASAVSTSWSPDSRGVVRFTLSDGSKQIGLSVLVNLLQEFWPEVRRHEFRPR